MKYINQIYKYSLLLITLTSLIGGLVYKIYSLNYIGIIISTFLIITSFFIILLLDKKFNNTIDLVNNSVIRPKNGFSIILKINKYWLNILYLLLFLTSFYILIKSKTDEAIISPWETVPILFFVLYFFSTIIIFYNSFFKKNNSLFLLTMHFFLSFQIANVVYKIFYGYDPFIHQATLELIDKNGYVDPKPFYYLGQYSLIIILHKITFIPTFVLNKFLVPFLSSLFLPHLLNNLLVKWFGYERKNMANILILLIFPFTFFISTTPQTLSYFFLLIIIIKSLTCNNFSELILIYLLSFAALITQPIIGIPAIFFSIILTIYHSKIKKYKNLLYFVLYGTSSITLPLSFLFINKPGHINFEIFSFSSIKNSIFPWFSAGMPYKDDFVLNAVYLYKFNISLFLISVIAMGIVLYFRYKNECKIFPIFFYMSVSLFLSYILTNLMPFDFLISYERTDYSNRILSESIFFLFPFLILAIHNISLKIKNQNILIQNIFIIFFSFLITTSLYLSYPRFDDFYNSRGYSTSKSDFDTVTWIEDNHKNNDFIVLANQQVSAAALFKYGFVKYYNDNVFYYPIPTGGQLYQYYLEMVYGNPSRETMNKAMTLAGVNEAYFVLNKYWWASPKIKDETKIIADSFHEINNGENIIFKFSK